MTAEDEFERLCVDLGISHHAVSGSMFGKRCIKVGGKAAVALFRDSVVFKLPGESHAAATALADACLWDPSGKGRAMKEWVQLPVQHAARYDEFAVAASDYVQQ